MSKESDDDNEVIEDVLGNSKRLRQKHKNDLRLNYDSDSSDDDYASDNNNNGDGGDDEGKGANNAEDDDDDDDMFASDKEEPVENNVKTKAREVQFLDVKEFEKTEGLEDYDDEKDAFIDDDRNEEGDEEDDGNEDEEEEETIDNADYYNNVEDFDETKRQLKKKDVKIEAFNLREEANEGKFDLEGNFIPNQEDDEQQVIEKAEEEWISSYKKSDINKAKRAQEERKKREEQEQIRRAIDSTSIETLLLQLIALLEPSETPMEALARLGPKKSRHSKKVANDDDDDGSRKEAVIKITDLCDKLIYDKYLRDVYELSREELMRKYQQETGESYTDHLRGVKRAYEEEIPDDTETIDYGEKIWEFKWIGEEEILGPYSNYEMNHWKETYFDNKVLVRKVGSQDFVSVEQIHFEDI
ncbi:uncharacterized protein RJT21DRAFT_11029 [Scheffersomyces amazonensis]|uniref:uncharacterized protein n=1 Tax=Scheffersomyces amazonensis TaxID=1078765 RepID=UPI00315C6669